MNRDSEHPAKKLFDQGRHLVNRQKLQEAHHCFQRVLEIEPTFLEDEPGMQSYFGYTLAMVENREREGLRLLNNAISTDGFRADHYLNLGKYYLIKKRNRKKALNSLFNGLKNCPGDPEIKQILDEMGTRKKPFFSFFARKNFLNRFLGRTFRSRKKQKLQERRKARKKMKKSKKR